MNHAGTTTTTRSAERTHTLQETCNWLTDKNRLRVIDVEVIPPRLLTATTVRTK